MEKILSRLFDLDIISFYDKYTHMFSNPNDIDMQLVLPESVYENYEIDREKTLEVVYDLDKENYHKNIVD